MAKPEDLLAAASKDERLTGDPELKLRAIRAKLR
jgi:hypothetical protein